MENKKTDESVKTTLPVDAGNIPAIDTEKDPDELVHEREEELPDTAAAEQDVDDLVHAHVQTPEVNELEETDIDDVMHSSQNDTGEEDQR